MNVSNYSSFVVPGEVAGRYTKLLIDSDALLTLINLYFFNQLPRYCRERAQPPPPNHCLRLADRSQLYVKYAYFKRRQGKMRKQHREEDTMMNEVNYILSAAKQLKIPPFHVSNIQVTPNKPFSQVDKRSERDEYEVTSIKHTLRAANGIITPRTYMTLQVANLTNKKIIVHTNQPFATMTRLNEIQINTIQQGKQQLVTDNVPAIPNEEPGLTNTELNKDQKEKIRRLIKEYPDVFTKSAGRTKELTSIHVYTPTI